MMKTTIQFLTKMLILTVLFSGCRNLTEVRPEFWFIKKGEVSDLVSSGVNWTTSKGSLNGSGVNNYLVAGQLPAEGDFRVHVRLSLDSLHFSAASLMIGGNHFGFDVKSEDGRSALFVEGPLFGKAFPVPGSEGKIKAGVPFDADVVLAGSEVSFLINGEKLFSKVLTGSLNGILALRPWRSAMRVVEFGASGNLVPVSKLTWLLKAALQATTPSGSRPS